MSLRKNPAFRGMNAVTTSTRDDEAKPFTMEALRRAVAAAEAAPPREDIRVRSRRALEKALRDRGFDLVTVKPQVFPAPTLNGVEVIEDARIPDGLACTMRGDRVTGVMALSSEYEALARRFSTVLNLTEGRLDLPGLGL